MSPSYKWFDKYDGIPIKTKKKVKKKMIYTVNKND